MQETNNRFNINTDDPLWIILRDANNLHVSQGQKYLQLFYELKQNGVKFSDIKRHMLNRAKKTGLYRRDFWSDATKQMEYKPVSKLALGKVAWYIALSNFCSWVYNNYVSYEEKKGRIARKVNANTSQKTIVTRKQNGETVSTEVTTTKLPSTSGISNNPVVAKMSKLDILAIILQNLEVLKEYSLEKGAEDQFNAFMDAIGSEVRA